MDCDDSFNDFKTPMNIPARKIVPVRRTARNKKVKKKAETNAGKQTPTLDSTNTNVNQVKSEEDLSLDITTSQEIKSQITASSCIETPTENSVSEDELSSEHHIPSQMCHGNNPHIKLADANTHNSSLCDDEQKWICVICKQSISLKDKNGHFQNCLKSYDHKQCALPSNFEIVSCTICNTDITGLTVVEKSEHVNRCLDSSVENLSTAVDTPNATSAITITECPLCLRQCNTVEARLAHIKKCSKSKGIDVQSVIRALKLQQKHTYERIALGLPQIQQQLVERRNIERPLRKVVREPKSQAEADFELAKALSISFQEEEERKDELSLEQLNLDSFRLPNQNSILNLRPPNVKEKPTKRKKNNVKKPIPLLVLRTDEERRKLFEERISNILAPIQSDIEESKPDSSADLKDCPLWTLAGESLERPSYYVEDLTEFVAPSDVETGCKLKNLSQVPGHHVYTQKPCDFTFSSSQDLEAGTSSQTKAPDIPTTQQMIDIIISDDNEMVAASQSQNHCVDDSKANTINKYSTSNTKRGFFCDAVESNSMITSLKTIVGNEWMSDVDIILSDDNIVPAHALLLKLRCPALRTVLGTVESERCVLDWQDVTSESVLHFLQYVYTGVKQCPSALEKDFQKLEVRCGMNFPEGDTCNILANAQAEQCSSKRILPKCDANDGDEPVVELLEPLSNKSDAFADTKSKNQKVFQAPSEVIDTKPVDENDINNTPKVSEEVVIINDYSKIGDHDLVLPNCTNSDHDSDDLMQQSPELFTHVTDDENSCANFEHMSVNSGVSSDEHIDDDELDTTAELFPEDTEHNVQCGVSNSYEPVMSNNDTDITILKNTEREKRDSVFKESFSSREQMSYYSSESNLYVSPNFCGYNEETVKFSIVPKEINVSNISKSSTSLDMTPDISFSPPSVNVTVRRCRKYIPTIDNSITSIKTPTNDDLDINNISECRKDSSRLFSECDAKDLQTGATTLVVSPIDIKNNSVFETSVMKPSICSSIVVLSSDDEMMGAHVNDISSHKMPEAATVGKIEDRNIEVVKEKAIKNSYCESYFNDDGGDDDELVPLHLRIRSNDSNNSPKSSQSSDVIESLVPPFSGIDEYLNKKFEKSLSAKPSTVSCSNPTDSRTPNIFSSCKAILSDSPITPFPDYKNMVTPEIKLALNKYGVRALPKKKAIAILTHIYDETHPFVNAIESEKSSDVISQQPLPSSKRIKKRKINSKELAQDSKPCEKKSKTKSTESKQDSDRHHTENGASSSSQMSSKSDNSDVFEDFFPEVDDDDVCSQVPSECVKTDVFNFIRSQNNLYSKILTYEPLNLTEFQQELKTNGIKISMSQLMDYLDEECITFSVSRSEKFKKKQQVRNQRFRKRAIAQLSSQQSSQSTA